MKDVPPQEMSLRSPDEVMRLRRMGAMFPTRLSFARSLLRDLAAEKAQVKRSCWEMSPEGFGHAVYSLGFGSHTYSLVAISRDLPDDQRSDRVIATAWDTSYVLYDGVPDADEIKRICATAPLQEAARFTDKDLVLSRANKSGRLFSHVVKRLRQGLQPDESMLREVGYLLRTTAVYGNGKFGISDRYAYADRPGLRGPFRVEMMCVFLIRQFSIDLVEHVGQGTLEGRLKRFLGVGNATGLGMAPFLVNHPVLLNNWMVARETALARVCAQSQIADDEADRLRQLHDRASRHLGEWQVSDEQHGTRLKRLRQDWQAIGHVLSRSVLSQSYPLEAVLSAARGRSVEAEELAVALLLEPFGALIDDLADDMAAFPDVKTIDFASTSDIGKAIATDFHWAMQIDFDEAEEQQRFWYVSACKQEPRLGNRYLEQGAERETALDIARRISNLNKDLPAKAEPLSVFLTRHPEHALAAYRVSLSRAFPFAEIRDNLIGEACSPVDMLRCKLSFFGATRFDPKSDRWTRITLYQGAPLVDELPSSTDDWWMPVLSA